MDWLKDKKNQPIVAAILAVIIVGVGVLLYFTVFSSGSSDTAGTDAGVPPDQQAMGTPAQSGPAPGANPAGTAPTAPAGTPAAPTTAAPPTTGAATAPAGQPATGAAVAAAPLETWRGDPFLPVGYKPPPKNRPKPRILDFPFITLPHPVSQQKLPPPVEKAQPIRRLAGVMLNGRVFAIIESNGKSDIVQPGQPLSDGLATVERIEADKVILKTIDKTPRYLVVRLASAPRRPSSTTSPTETVTPGGGPMGVPMYPSPGVRPMPRRPMGPPT